MGRTKHKESHGKVKSKTHSSVKPNKETRYVRPHKRRGGVVVGGGSAILASGIASMPFFPIYGVPAILVGGVMVALGAVDIGLKEKELKRRKQGIYHSIDEAAATDPLLYDHSDPAYIVPPPAPYVMAQPYPPPANAEMNIPPPPPPPSIKPRGVDNPYQPIPPSLRKQSLEPERELLKRTPTPPPHSLAHPLAATQGDEDSLAQWAADSDSSSETLSMPSSFSLNSPESAHSGNSSHSEQSIKSGYVAHSERTSPDRSQSVQFTESSKKRAKRHSRHSRHSKSGSFSRKSPTTPRKSPSLVQKHTSYRLSTEKISR